MGEYDEQCVPGVTSAKRVTIVHTPWMGDWFVSHSPRNGNSNAEGPWSHWVDLALSILQHEFTGLVRPELREAVKGHELRNYYSESDRDLTEEEIAKVMNGGSNE